MSSHLFSFHRNVFAFRSSAKVRCLFRRDASSSGSAATTSKNRPKRTQLDLRGIFPPIITPFNSKGAVDFDKLAKNMKHWNKIPFKGIVVQGSNGEYIHLNTTERIDLVRRVAHLAAEDKVIIAGSGCESTSSTIELTAKMAAAGANFALVKTPSFFKGNMSNASYITHFTKVADESPIPVLLYNVPAFTGVDLDPEVIHQLAPHPNIIGLKDSGGDISKIGNLVFLTKDHDFQILAGSAGFLYPALMMGCVGGVCALANSIGQEVCDLQILFEEGKYKEAMELQQRLIGPNIAVTRKYGVAGLKQSMEFFGLYGGSPRLPLLPLNKQQILELKKEFTSRGFELNKI